MNIPGKMQKILETDRTLLSLVLDVEMSFSSIYKDNKLFFFEEYTDHGIEHIELVLKATEFLIPNESFDHIQPKEIAILVLAILLHDMGMHIEFSTFKAMIGGEYDNVKVDTLDKNTWKELWQDYLSEIRHFSSKQKESIFGNPNEVINELDLSNKDKLTGIDKKVIGEFIRRHHARLAHEIALKGLIGNSTIFFGDKNLDDQDRKFIGIVARSHGMNIRDTFDYLKEIAYDDWKNPGGMNIIFLMVLLRIADYLQIDKTRTNKTLLKVKTFNSSISLKEHQTHLAISGLNIKKEDPELIYVTAEPEDAQMYVKIQNLINDIQHEFDLSWAILGEIYGFLPTEKPKIKFRRITSNLEHSAFLKKINYVPKKIAFEVNDDVAKLLIAPLYGDNPTYGVRELVQNATDACKERMKIEEDKGNTNYEPIVTVSIDKIDKEKYLFKIKDNGKGMTLDEIQNYFLSVGSSFRQTFEWKKEFEGNVTRNGKFGVGVLAAFLLGDEISVKTKSYKNDYTYSFRTTLDSDFVEIEKKNNEFEVGTEIEILMSFDRYHNLPTNSRKGSDLLWFDWYIDEKPLVLYTLNGKVQTKHMFFNPVKTQTFLLKNNDKICWSYQPVKERIINDKQYSGAEITNWKFVVCNGIIITLNTQKDYFTQQDSSIISKKPSLIIEDSQNILPLRLDRNELDEDVLPFEDELFTDISKSFIAQLLTFPIISTEVKVHEKDDCFSHIHEGDGIDFYYSKNGFTLAYDYFITKLRTKRYHLLKIIVEYDFDAKQDFSPIFQKFDNYIIYPTFEAEINASKDYEGTDWLYERAVAPDSGGRILLPRKIYNRFKYSPPPRWREYRFQIEWENEKYVVYNLRGYNKKTDIFEQKICASIMRKLGKNVQSIQEIPFSYFSSNKSGTILNKLFNKYIGNNVIIPYDMEERKKLYPLAFEELKNYMKYNEKF